MFQVTSFVSLFFYSNFFFAMVEREVSRFNNALPRSPSIDIKLVSAVYHSAISY